MEKYYIGIDIGGTKIIVVLTNSKYKIIERIVEKTGDTRKEKEIIEKISSIIYKMKKNFNIESIGIGVAGFVDYKKGIILSSPNIKFLKNYFLSNKFEENFKIKTFIENDVKAGAVAEMFLGEGKDTKNFVYITLGTGIGSAIVSEGRIIRGANNLAGEIGHLTLTDEGFKCGCGKYGCLETISSGPYIRKYVIEELKKGRISKVTELVKKEKIENMDVKDIIKAAKEGDSLSNEALNYAVKALARGMSYLINTLNPDKIIIGGGLSNIYFDLREELFLYLKKYALPIPLKNTKLVQTKLGVDGVAIGASIIGKLRLNGEIY